MKSVSRTIIIFMICCLLITSCGNSKGNTTMTHSAQESTLELLSAVEKQDSKLVSEIVKSKPNLEIKDNKGRTALMIATKRIQAKNKYDKFFDHVVSNG